MGLFKRKKVPSELPELALDDFESGEKEVHDYLKKEEAKKPQEIKPTQSKEEVKEVSKPVIKKQIEKRVKTNLGETEKEKVAVKEESEEHKIEKPITESKSVVESKTVPENEKGFFSDLQKNLNEEISDFEEFEEWYKDKFEKRDVIKEMKGYWENQKTASVIKVLGKNFQEKISEKIAKLQELEKTWQGIYFELVEKEEEIKEQELELKDLLSEFVRICKKKTEEPKKEIVNKKKDESLKKVSSVKQKQVKKILKKPVAVKNKKVKNEKTKKVN